MSDKEATVITQDVETAAEQEKTFTQAEMNAIIGKRLSEERAKYADYDALKEKAKRYDDAEEASKSELQKMTEKATSLQARLDTMLKADSVRKVREQVAAEMKVPVNLLTGEDEETCKAQATAILEFAKPAGYPRVRDVGEARQSGGKMDTRDQFAQWFTDNIGGN